jgi:hypothetical protein
MVHTTMVHFKWSTIESEPASKPIHKGHTQNAPGLCALSHIPAEPEGAAIVRPDVHTLGTPRNGISTAAASGVSGPSLAPLFCSDMSFNGWPRSSSDGASLARYWCLAFRGRKLRSTPPTGSGRLAKDAYMASCALGPVSWPFFCDNSHPAVAEGSLPVA